MSTLSRSSLKALAALLGLAFILPPAAMASASTKAPAKTACSLKKAKCKKAPAKKTCALKKKVKCTKARFTKVKVGKVNIAGADLRGAVITGATFNGTNLSGVNLSGASISNTTFTGVQVAGLVMDGATLSGVRFVGARITGAGALESEGRQREQECTATDVQTAYDTPLAFTCSGGGMSFRGATILNKATAFVLSTIPRSDFRDVEAGRRGLLSFEGTDVRDSDFQGAVSPLSFMAARRGVGADWTWSNVSGSVLDGTKIQYISATRVMNASFLGTTYWFGPRSVDVDMAGTRGRFGAAAVTIVGPGGAVPPGLRTVQIGRAHV